MGVVVRGEQVEGATVGSLDARGSAPMTRDSILQIASITKPIVAAAALILVDDGRGALADPIARWLPELTARGLVGVRTTWFRRGEGHGGRCPDLAVVFDA